MKCDLQKSPRHRPRSSARTPLPHKPLSCSTRPPIVPIPAPARFAAREARIGRVSATAASRHPQDRLATKRPRMTRGASALDSRITRSAPPRIQRSSPPSNHRMPTGARSPRGPRSSRSPRPSPRPSHRTAHHDRAGTGNALAPGDTGDASATVHRPMPAPVPRAIEAARIALRKHQHEHVQGDQNNKKFHAVATNDRDWVCYGRISV